MEKDKPKVLGYNSEYKLNSIKNSNLRKLANFRIWSHLLKKPLMENFIFCAVNEIIYKGINIRNFLIG